MDFTQILNDVSQYLTKQQKSMIANPRNISLINKRLDLYTTAFHSEIQELFQLEGKPFPNLDIHIKKPELVDLDLSETEKFDDISRKLKQASSKGLREIQEYERRNSGLLAYHDYEDRSHLRKSLFRILETDLNFEKIGILERHIDTIDRHIIEFSLNGKTSDLKGHIKNLSHEKILKEYQEREEKKILQISDTIINNYQNYFNQCLEQYKSAYQSKNKLIDKSPSELRETVNIQSMISEKPEISDILDSDTPPIKTEITSESQAEFVQERRKIKSVIVVYEDNEAEEILLESKGKHSIELLKNILFD
ncbi:hypothetical protein V7182_22245 [Neobacillus drentensis]|uniref:hypothetical protein n=1 Tax=Neobacillus drentensis TaxID=220684 RepID=UPI002FFDC4E7